jgi:hypothetical protein
VDKITFLWIVMQSLCKDGANFKQNGLIEASLTDSHAAVTVE